MDLCLTSLEDVGFRRYRKDAVDWPLNKEFNGWAGLNMAIDGDGVELNPFVGIHAVAIEKMWMSLSGLKYPGPYGKVATYSIHLGEIERLKLERSFAFAPKQSEEFIFGEASRLAKLYVEKGLDFSRSIASYDALLPLLRGRVSMLGGNPQRVSCCLYLLGMKADAERFVESFRQKEPGTFGKYATSFLDYLKSQRD